VRNWARMQIGRLPPLRNIFFRLTRNFPNACLQQRAFARASDVAAALNLNRR
jgi:hypothetical protein